MRVESQIAKPKGRVLVVDNEPKTVESHCHNLRRWGYEPVIAEGVGEELLASAKEKVHEYACHLALVDMHLIDDHDTQDKSGLALVPELKPALAIIVSGSGNDRATVLEALRNGAIDIIGKQEPLQRLQDALEEAVRQTGSCYYGPEVDIAPPLVARIMEALAPGKPEQVTEILKQLFPGAKRITAELYEESAETPSVTLRKKSFILKVRADSKQPLAVKITTPQRIEQEYERFQTHIKDRLPGHFYADVENKAVCWQLGGIKYKFIGTNINTFTVFSKYYSNGTVEDICKALTHLFHKVWHVSYIHNPRNAAYHSLFEAYSSCWGTQWVTRLHAYTASLKTPIYTNSWLGIFPDPVLWVQERTGNFGEKSHNGEDETTKYGPFQALIGHGDLQGDNFFVSDKHQTWTIDYERTGYGPSVQDFVLLELDVWVRLSAIEDPKHFIQLLLLMTAESKFDKTSTALSPQVAEQPEVNKAHAAIDEIRNFASNYLDNQEWRVYYWGMLLNAVFRIVLRTDKLTSTVDPHRFRQYAEELERAQLVASVLCRRLENWFEDWPPPEWQRVYAEDDVLSSATSALGKSQRFTATILFLSALPKDYLSLQIDKELRTIKEILAKSAASHLKLVQQEAVRVTDLRHYLLTHKPRLLHFAGHADQHGDIVLEDEAGNSNSIPTEALGEMLRTLSDDLCCVILNACYTTRKAKAIAAYVDAVVVMEDAIDDRSALAFTTGFYQALAHCQSVQQCFDAGRSEIRNWKAAGAELCKLFTRFDASKLYL